MNIATDTHCHLERFPRPPDVLSRSRAAGIRIIAVTSKPSDFRFLFPLYGRREGVRLALGLHPLEVGRIDLSRELQLLRAYADHTSYIGEVGLDFSPEGQPCRGLQEEALECLLQVPGVTNKLMTVHSRGAAAETIHKFQQAGARRVILHWYSGSLGELNNALDAGFYFSINPAMTRTRKGREIIERVPADRVLLESDGPYARIGGRPTNPSDVLVVRDYFASQWRATPGDVSRALASNLRTLCDGLGELVAPDAASGARP
jgi:TatD DNase family protein